MKYRFENPSAFKPHTLNFGDGEGHIKREAIFNVAGLPLAG